MANSTEDVKMADGEEETLPQQPTSAFATSELLDLAQMRFRISLPDNLLPPAKKADLKKQILGIIEKNKMAPYYKHLCKQLGWELDETLLSTLEASNTADLERFSSRLADAEATQGESEVRELLLSKAEFLATIGSDKDATIAAFRAAEEKTVALGQRLDLVFAIIRVAYFWNDSELVRRSIDKAKTLVEEGGDWERRNRLKVYEGVFSMLSRDFKKAAQLFLDSLATFTSYELFSYKDFVFYTVLTTVVALDRVTLRKQVVNAPEILTAINDVPNLSQFLYSLYKCRYAEFFRSLSVLHDQLACDRYLSAHVRYLMRETRVVVYSQFLESYRSVTLDSMAAAFGVSVDLIDRELSRFIVAGRLNCKIDKVGGVVETNRPDAKNHQYQQTIKQGDVLLNRIQKLSRVISY